MMRSNGEILSLTGLRALAAIWVVGLHFWDLSTSLLPSLIILEPLFSRGYLGVDVFFVLSGFIITHTYLHKFTSLNTKEYRRFLWLRLARIYPVYIFSLILMLLMFFAAAQLHVNLNKQYDYSMFGFISFVFMIQGWGNSAWYPWNGPAWSVSAEWFAYLTFPLVALLVTRIKSVKMIVACIVFSISLSILIRQYEILKLITPFDFGNIVRVIGAFVAGALACQLYRLYDKSSLSWHVWCPAVIILFLGLATTSQTLWVILLIPAIILGIAYDKKSIVANWLSSKSMVYLGKISYSVYLIHMIVKFFIMGLLMKYVVNSAMPLRISFILFSLLLVIISASLAYHFIEEPVRKFVRNIVDGRVKRNEASIRLDVSS